MICAYLIFLTLNIASYAGIKLPTVKKICLNTVEAFFTSWKGPDPFVWHKKKKASHYIPFFVLQDSIQK